MADPGTCFGCKTCMAACLHRHDAPGDVAVPRLTLVTTRTVSAPVGCHHCADAPCVAACPTKALRVIDQDYLERGMQAKRRAAARATAAFSSIAFNAELDEEG